MSEFGKVILKPETPGHRMERLVRHGKLLQRTLTEGGVEVHLLVYPDENGDELDYLLLNHEGWGLPPPILQDPEYVQNYYRGILSQDEIEDKLEAIRKDVGMRDFLYGRD